ncbi:MAG: hypothetical protein V2J26_04865 [Pacificimonas sp.]|jgi:hypothetical protein|nr:hypothetical protein [Pacificimonas sp.]
MTDEPKSPPPASETERLAKDPEITVPAEIERAEPVDAAGEDPIRPASDREPFEIPEELVASLKETGREWQGKAEAALALWLDEASLSLRKEGMQGLRKTMEEKAEKARAKAESGELNQDIDRLVSKVVGTIGRDVAASAIGSALAGLAAAADARRTAEEQPKAEPAAEPADGKPAADTQPAPGTPPG